MCNVKRLTAALLAGGMMLAAPAAVMAEELTEALTEGSENIASASEMTTVDDVVEEWMVPIPAADIENGVYDVEVLSSSAMFPIEEAVLVVSDDSMSLKMMMGGDGYLYVYPGTPEEAASADEADYIAYEEDDQGRQTYTIPVDAVDDGIKCAAFSRKKEKWYDRTLVIPSYSLPGEALPEAEMTTVEELALADGEYTVEALLQGGSGKASIASPAALTVEDGEVSLEVIFSSPHYDYMIVDGVEYRPVNEEGNSTFIIPVSGFDYAMPVTADTTAMSKAHEIEYTILLDSSTIK